MTNMKERVSMKKFRMPQMSVVLLSGEEVIATSGCETNMCMGFDCPDCPTQCDGIYHCEVFKCSTY